jgi:DNA invertase Pin-like site-specific DNA recombinase
MRRHFTRSSVNSLVGRWTGPQLHKALEQLREGDVLFVWKLDRLSRSLNGMLSSFSS